MSDRQITDVVVMGGGPAGYVAAIRAAQLGAQTVLVEKNKLGGVCLNAGCIPTKTLIRSCEIFSLVKRAQEFGLEIENSKVNLEKLMQRKNRIVARLVGSVGYLLKKNKVQVITGEAKILNASTVRVQGSVEQTIQANHIVIATGSHPANISLPGVDKEAVMTSTEALEIKDIPENLLIVGAGAVGIELAHIYNTLGSKVSIVEMLPRILPGEDAEICDKLQEIMEKSGIEIFTNSTLTSAQKEGQSYRASIKTAAGEKLIPFEKILVSIGRKPNSNDLGLEKAGVETDKQGWIKVNANMQTTVPNIYAAGDIVGGYLLAHVAYMEAEAAAENVMGKNSKMNYKLIPRFVCSMPEIAAVGLTEEKAKENGYQVEVGIFPFTGNGKAMIHGEREGMVKIVTDAGTEEILGVHILGPQASELILEPTLAISLESTTQEIIDTIHPHPAFGEAIREAALAVQKRAIHT